VRFWYKTGWAPLSPTNCKPRPLQEVASTNNFATKSLPTRTRIRRCSFGRIKNYVEPDQVVMIQKHGHYGVAWFQASAAMLMRSAFFCDITRRRVVILYRRFGTTYRSHLQGSRVREEKSRTLWPLKMGPICCPETSVKITTRRRVISQKSVDPTMMEGCTNFQNIYNPPQNSRRQKRNMKLPTENRYQAPL
jgi:hypothetical protein